MAEKETGASRAATQRNLDRLTEAELIREVTGQGRYRLWTAKL
jgi:DNA-binding IclR family transcriptional regulator